MKTYYNIYPLIGSYPLVGRMGENRKMNKRILATLCVTIFVLATIATVSQVSAHYTLGDQLPMNIGETNAGGLPIQPTSGAGNGNPRFHGPDAGGHVAGHMAFAQPGTLYVTRQLWAG